MNPMIFGYLVMVGVSAAYSCCCEQKSPYAPYPYGLCRVVLAIAIVLVCSTMYDLSKLWLKPRGRLPKFLELDPTDFEVTIIVVVVTVPSVIALVIGHASAQAPWSWRLAGLVMVLACGVTYDFSKSLKHRGYLPRFSEWSDDLQATTLLIVPIVPFVIGMALFPVVFSLMSMLDGASQRVLGWKASTLSVLLLPLGFIPGFFDRLIDRRRSRRARAASAALRDLIFAAYAPGVADPARHAILLTINMGRYLQARDALVLRRLSDGSFSTPWEAQAFDALQLLLKR